MNPAPALITPPSTPNLHMTTPLCLGKKESVSLVNLMTTFGSIIDLFSSRVTSTEAKQDVRTWKKNTFCECPQIYLVKKIHFSWVSSNLASVDSLTSSVLLPGPPPLSLNSWPVEKTEMPMLCARANCTEAWIAYWTRIWNFFLNVLISIIDCVVVILISKQLLLFANDSW